VISHYKDPNYSFIDYYLSGCAGKVEDNLVGENSLFTYGGSDGFIHLKIDKYKYKVIFYGNSTTKSLYEYEVFY
jgi:hypothetical protein